MPIRNPADGHGATLTFAGFVANIIDINLPTWMREAIDKTHMGTVDWKESMPADLADPGEITGTCEFDAQALPPILEAEDTLTIVLGNAEGDQFITQAFMTSFGGAALKTGERMTCSFAFKCTGEPTLTPGS